MGMAVGIDLGTTNTVVSAKKISAMVLRNAEGEELTPSWVTAVPHGDGETYDLVVGKPARDLMKQYPDQTVMSIKRLMGREFDDIEVQRLQVEHRSSYRIETNPSEPGLITVPLGGKNRTPEEISSLILNKVVTDAGVDAGAQIDAAVVTVPAYFSDRQKFATRAACDLAGLHLLRLLPEPTAAAISFGLGEDKESVKTVMVFDLGGGTFDLSVLNVNQGIFMEIAKGGDMWLGGDNIDHLLIDHVYKEVEKAGGPSDVRELVELLPPRDRARFIAEMKEKCEAAKIRLSSQESAAIELFGILRDRDQSLVDIDVRITREEFDHLIAPLVARLAEMTSQLLYEIRFEPDLVDSILMVGGSSLVPAIQEGVKRIFGAEKVIIHPRPMAAVAEGAAWMASHLVGSASESMTMMHSVAHDYYIQLAGGQRHLLVARNSPLPAVVEEKFRFAAENQLVARLRVFNEVDGIMETVGELWFHADRAAVAKGQREELNLRFSVNEDNIISLEVTSLTNPKRKVLGQIARGGVVIKLFGDLERAMSEAVAISPSQTTSVDALELSARIVDTILDSADPRTGATRPEKKRLAQSQISTLGELLKKQSSPLARTKFAHRALEVAKPVLNAEQAAELRELSHSLDYELTRLENPNALDKQLTQLGDFWDRAPKAVRLTQAHLCIENAGKSALARTLQEQVNRLIRAHEEGNSEVVERAESEITREIITNFDLRDAPSRRFDRDVTL
ncbi:MAG: Hsp70 family protein [Bdellovibrionales bacterium]